MTSADGSVGLNAFSGSIKAMGTTITTEGGLDILSNPSYGVEVSNSDGTVTLINDTIKTSGPGAVGLLAQASGTATLSGTIAVTTTDLTNTQGSAIGLYALSGGKIDGSGATSVSVTTSGTGAIGVYASGSADDANDSVDDQDHGRHDHHQWDDGDRRSGRWRRAGDGERRLGDHEGRFVDRGRGERRGFAGDADRGGDGGDQGDRRDRA